MAVDVRRKEGEKLIRFEILPLNTPKRKTKTVSSTMSVKRKLFLDDDIDSSSRVRFL
jgi:hypothetical protein